MDTLAIWRKDQIEVVECAKCGHHQRQTSQMEVKQLRPQEQVIAIFHPD